MSYLIPSFNPKTKDIKYHVFKNRNDKYVCECPAYRFGKGRDPAYVCKHIKLLKILKSEDK